MKNNKFEIKLRPTEVADLENLFRFQLDDETKILFDWQSIIILSL